MGEIWIKWFKEGLKNFGINFNEREIQVFKNYLSLIKEWNKKFNLTGEKTDESVAIKQFLDSLTPLYWKSTLSFKRGIDIGTGAGIPGIPIKIFFPEMEMVLVESMRKRVLFLNHSVKHLFLKEVRVINERAENLWRNKEFREEFDTVFARWVLKIPGIFEVSIPFAEIGGRVFLWKGEDEVELIKKEEEFIKELGGEIEDIFFYKLPYFESERVLLIIKKVNKTPERFPRRWKVIKSLSSQRYRPQT